MPAITTTAAGANPGTNSNSNANASSSNGNSNSSNGSNSAPAASAVSPQEDPAAHKQPSASSGFTAVNGTRASPPDSRGPPPPPPPPPPARRASPPAATVPSLSSSNGSAAQPSAAPATANGASNGYHHHHHHRQTPYQLGRDSPDEPDRKPVIYEWPPASHSSARNGAVRPVSPPPVVDLRNTSPSDATGKRKRSPSDDETSPILPDPRSRLGTYPQSMPRDTTETHTHSLPPIDTRPSDRAPMPARLYHPLPEQSHRETPWPAPDRIPAEADRRRPEPINGEVRRMLSPEDMSNGDGADHSVMQGPTEPSNTTEITRAGVQVDPKKRKRQFANRTKTGCQTCRRRKKKCDEMKPECYNCMRGGFLCEGYINKATWTKPSVQKAPVPLQSKEGYPEPQVPQQYHRHSQIPSYSDPAPQTPADGGRSRPILVDDHDRQLPRSSNPWTGVWPDPAQHRHAAYSSAQEPHASKPPDYSPAHGPDHDRNRGKEYGPPHPPPQSMPYAPPPNPAYEQPPQSHVNTSQSSLPPAHMAMHHPSSVRHPARLPAPVKTEKEKMLTGGSYKLMDPQLLDEREQCKAALWRFNNATNPNVGVSREERSRLFRAVVEAQWLRNANSTASQPTGSVGKDVCVEAPFTCEYGYNIHVGDDVLIGSNCTILDPCKVTIGVRTIIGPNVNIYGNTVSSDPRYRRGSQGNAIGKRVVIEEDCFIGGNVTILPGVHIGKGATIGAGSVVARNVPQFTVASGNPLRVLRGIYTDPPI